MAVPSRSRGVNEQYGLKCRQTRKLCNFPVYIQVQISDNRDIMGSENPDFDPKFPQDGGL